MSGGIAAELAGWAAALRPTDEDLATARRSLLDTVAVTVAAREDRLNAIAAGLGPGGRMAVAAHLRDYDDLHLPSTSHVSAVCVPAVVAAGGDARAYLAAAGVMARLGTLLGWPHYTAGWHATCTAGAPAAAIAAGVAAGLDAEGLARAMALAVPAAGGNHRAFGTEAKSLQVGFAVDAGLRAAALAAAGASADPTTLDAWIGLLRGGDECDIVDVGATETGTADADAAGADAADAGTTDADATGPAIPGGLAIKLHPCCYALQRPIAATRDALGERRTLPAGEVAAIEVTAPEGTLRPLIHDRPTTGLEGKFSLQYAIAATLLDSAPDLDSFADAAVARPEAQDLLPKIKVRRTPGDGDLLVGTVTVALRLAGGEALTATVELPPGAPGRPPSEAELGEKLAACAGSDADVVAGLDWAKAGDAVPRLLGWSVGGG
jgi:2-methylcitrate dehydratase PrpD